MRRRLLLLSTVLIALAVAPVATANKPMREIHPGQDDVPITGQCAFPVLLHIEGGEIITTFTNKEGDPIKQIGVFPGNTLTLTNLDSGKSITLVSTGAFHARVEPDGSGFFMATGPGPNIPNPITGEPGIWYQTGRLIVTFDAEGNQTSVDFTGRLIDLCPQLAS